jgi:glycosyltransferase involved in cell wall biosynthesis
VDCQQRVPAARKRPRMAYVSPLPPERSGIADYSAEVLPELAKYYEIELITDLAAISDPVLQREFRRVTFEDFRKSARAYERILYQIGNSPFHAQVPSLLENYPGPVVMHDFFLSHLFKHLEVTDGVSLWRNLYLSHGYPGLLARARQGADAAVWAYPCNLAVLSYASGIIVHSDHARELARQWYGLSTDDWKVIPQVRRLKSAIDRQQARTTLGIAPDTFLVCSFGFLAPTKLNDLLFQSWLGSKLSRMPNCCLVFVGGDGAGRPYPVNGVLSNRVRATGYLSKEEYELYLAAADVGVQLRGELSRGETPRSVLDCMAQGLATIVSVQPALTELPADSVLKVSENCSSGELIAALERLYREPEYRAALGRQAQAHVATTRSPARIAKQYAEAVEEFASDQPATVTTRVDMNLAELEANTAPSDAELATVASPINGAANMRQLLVDVTVLVSLGDYQSGIHRVTRAILAQLLAHPPAACRVEPVFRAHGQTYRYARRFAANCLHPEDVNVEDAPVAVNRGDVFLGLDWDPGIGADDQAANWLLHQRQRGMKTFFVVHDLLPLRRPDWFEPEMEGVFEAWLCAICRAANGLVCVSRAVADDLSAWCDKNLRLDARPLEIGYFHHGSDIEASWPSRGLTSEYETILDALRGREVLVMIGTVEPRKGHSQALSAIEHLWGEGQNLSLVVCGKQGWRVESITRRIRSHHELGHRLFWLEEATDEALIRLYSVASAVLMASEGEGFGLPLIEAAQHGLPIIARDLPVFREVAGEHAFYFAGILPTDLADALRTWLKLYRRGEHPKSNLLPLLSWQKSAQRLLEVVLEGRVYKHWRPAVEGFAPIHPAGLTSRVLSNLAELASMAEPSDGELATIASCIAENSRLEGVRQLLVDVTVLVSLGNEKTGIHRTTRGILAQLLENPPPGWRVEPVFRARRETYRYARKLAGRYLHLEALNLEDAPVAVNPGDVFLGLDWDAGIAVDDEAAKWLLHHRQRGMRTMFTIYDLLPLQHSEWFKPEMLQLFQAWLSRICRVASGFACISRAVADELIGWLDTRSAVAARTFDIGCFRLGSDLAASWASQGMSADDRKLLDALRGREVIAMIGTVEPRKGHNQALSAMEQLWREGEDLSLVICGKQGWLVESIAQRIRSHRELGRRLFWMDQATDEALMQLYALASGVLIASEGEGFGLPLVEAAQHGVAIIARDLPVFREVAGEHAFYFSGILGAELADALRSWLKLYRRGNHPKSNLLPRLSWQQSAQQLLQVVLDGKLYKRWRPTLDATVGQPGLTTAHGRKAAVPALELSR